MVSNREHYMNMNNAGYFNGKKTGHSQLLVIIYSIWQERFSKTSRIIKDE